MLKFNGIPVPDFITIESFISVFRQKHEDLIYEECYNIGEAHNFWEFLYLEEGEINVLVDGELHCLLPGQLIIYAPFSFHSVSSSSDAVINVVSFSCKSSSLSGLSNIAIDLSSEQVSSLRSIINLSEECFFLPTEISDERGMFLRKDIPNLALQKLAKLVELFLIDLCRNYSPVSKANTDDKNNPLDEQFAALTTFLSYNLHRFLSAEEISSELSISVSKLSKLCKAQCGCGPLDYFLSLKIGAAKRMISEKRLNLTQISEKLGFSSVHYFSRLFKAKTGITPSEYAKNAEQ